MLDYLKVKQAVEEADFSYFDEKTSWNKKKQADVEEVYCLCLGDGNERVGTFKVNTTEGVFRVQKLSQHATKGNCNNPVHVCESGK